MPMKPLILASDQGAELTLSDLADCVILFFFRFVSGPLPSPHELATYVAARSEKQPPGSHWSTYAVRCDEANRGRRDLSLIEFCQPYETIELWFGPEPNEQLQLIWLLDFFRSHPETVRKLRLRCVDYKLIAASPEEMARWKMLVVDVTTAELETASMSWQAYRAPTPEACVALLSKDLSALPLLRPVLLDLLAELPSASTGLGATEMRMLELIGRGYSLTNALFHLPSLRQTRVFDKWENGYLLDGLAFGPRPAVTGLDEALRMIGRKNLRDRETAYLRSELSLTEFGKSILAHKEDFSRHNPIDRWWGGTQLTNDRLWRRDPALIAPTKR
jgi:hypothetical protein